MPTGRWEERSFRFAAHCDRVGCYETAEVETEYGVPSGWYEAVKPGDSHALAFCSAHCLAKWAASELERAERKQHAI